MELKLKKNHEIDLKYCLLCQQELEMQQGNWEEEKGHRNAQIKFKKEKETNLITLNF